jgi:hypothetical protein
LIKTSSGKLARQANRQKYLEESMDKTGATSMAAAGREGKDA